MKGKKLLSFVLMSIAGLTASAADQFVLFEQSAGAKLQLTQQKDTIVYDARDWKGVHIAVRNLRQDLEKVTGSPCAPIVVGTVGKSAEIDQMVKQKKIDGKALKGKREKYLLQVIDGKLVIAGSDKRGTIYGIYELSKQIGVSPWYYWADVPAEKHDRIYIKEGVYTDGEPAVRYRGIFLNDEAPALSGWNNQFFGKVFGHVFYEHVFELVLRCKGNFMWPAMWGSAFYADDELNMQTADDMGVMMGTSHHEPLARAQQEWKRLPNHGAWNFDTNFETLSKFWKGGVERMKHTEDVVTVGMRGDGDEPMAEKTDVKLLERIVATQRKLIEEATGKPAKETPQVWALYKEVQEYYEKGMKVPDDVILLLCDDNWGNVRILPELKADKKGEKWFYRHPGGYGMYYHVDYVGAPRNSKWINISQVQRMWDQMKLTYDYGVDQLWILNVGDLKPMELPIDFWFKMAWNPNFVEQTPRPIEGETNLEGAEGPLVASLQPYLEDYCREQFGGAFKENKDEEIKEAARLLNLGCKYVHRRTAEQLTSRTYSLENGEWGERLAEYKILELEVEEQYQRMAPEYRDAYDEIVRFPIRAMSNLYEMYYAQAKQELLAQQGSPEADLWAERVKKCFDKDAALCYDYNHRIAGGKWNHMMDQTHIGYRSWQEPRTNTMPTAVERNREGLPMKTFFPYKNVVTIDPTAYNEKVDGQEAKWTVVPDMGIYGSTIALMPYHKSTEGASIRYAFQSKVEKETEVTVSLHLATNFPYNSGTGAGLNIRIDDQLPTYLNTNGTSVVRYDNATGDMKFDWETNRVNIRKVTLKIKPNENGLHLLTINDLDPGIALQRITIEGELPTPQAPRPAMGGFGGFGGQRPQGQGGQRPQGQGGQRPQQRQ